MNYRSWFKRKNKFQIMLNSNRWFYIWNSRLRPSTRPVRSIWFHCTKNGSFPLKISSLLQIWSNLLKKSSLYTTQKVKFSMKDFFSKCDQIRSSLRIWSHLLKKSLIESFIYCTVFTFDMNMKYGCDLCK